MVFQNYTLLHAAGLYVQQEQGNFKTTHYYMQQVYMYSRNVGISKLHIATGSRFFMNIRNVGISKPHIVTNSKAYGVSNCKL